MNVNIFSVKFAVILTSSDNITLSAYIAPWQRKLPLINKASFGKSITLLLVVLIPIDLSVTIKLWIWLRLLVSFVISCYSLKISPTAK